MQSVLHASHPYGNSRLEWASCCLQKPASNSRRTALPKAPPNDPQRQGNIWHRYEQLEGSTKQLAAVNQQISDERDQYKKVLLAGRASRL